MAVPSGVGDGGAAATGVALADAVVVASGASGSMAGAAGTGAAAIAELSGAAGVTNVAVLSAVNGADPPAVGFAAFGAGVAVGTGDALATTWIAGAAPASIASGVRTLAVVTVSVGVTVGGANGAPTGLGAPATGGVDGGTVAVWGGVGATVAAGAACAGTLTAGVNAAA